MCSKSSAPIAESDTADNADIFFICHFISPFLYNPN
jgi:hypothetical protein